LPLFLCHPTPLLFGISSAAFSFTALE
jgi:hypothetical protein